jgi:uncharacterized protein (TIGR00369 family)
MSEQITKSTFEFVRDNLAQTPFHHWLKPQLMSVDEQASSVTIHLPVRQDFARAANRPEVHGGVVAALIDITGHAAIAAKLHHGAATIDLRVDYLRLASGSELRAIGTVIKFGRTIGIVDVKLNDDQNKTVAIGRAAYLTKAI